MHVNGSEVKLLRNEAGNIQLRQNDEEFCAVPRSFCLFVFVFCFVVVNKNHVNRHYMCQTVF